MTLRHIRTSGLLLGYLLLLGCASSPGTADRHVERAAAQLQRRSDADSLAAAALLVTRKDHPQALALLSRAEQAEPSRADLVWLRLRICEAEPACDPQSDEQRLRALNPDNGAGWLDELTRAVRAQDAAATDAALAAIARTEHVNVYWTTLVGHLSPAAAHTGQLSLKEATLWLMGILSAVEIPAYAPTLKSCSGDRLESADGRDICRRVAAALENGDAGITEMIGVALAKRVWPEGSVERQTALERRRIHDYQTASLIPEEPFGWRGMGVQKFIALCLELPSEQELIRARLIAAGKDPNPPPG